jgi:metallo-beta-lactamase class B
LVASDQGLILIDGGLPQSAPQIISHIRVLGFDPKNIKLILNSHAHFDHAGGISEMQRVSGARVAASLWSATALRQGVTAPDDPQHDLGPTPIGTIGRVDVLHDGQTVRVGGAALTAHFTPGHTPGGTSWSWVSCEGKRCLHMVYADSLTAVSADNYRFSAHPELLRGFYKSFATLEALPCDILLSAHPGFSSTLQKLKARDSGQLDAFVDSQSCRKYAAAARVGLKKRLAQEAEK